jgi:two-component system, LuxR family, response regulator FixJ
MEPHEGPAPQRRGVRPAGGTAPPPLVHVVDDDDAMRRSLVLLLRAAGYSAEAHASGEALLAALGREGEAGSPEPGVAPVRRPACAVVDVLMPGGMDGITLLAKLARRGAALPVVVVTGHADVPLAVRAMRAGAVDFVEKPYPKERILLAVSEALDAAAEPAAERGAADSASAAAAQARLAALTPRERMVLRGLVCGSPNKVIAHELGISPRTVEAHRAAVMEKLGARSLAEAVRLALAAGLDGEATG